MQGERQLYKSTFEIYFKIIISILFMESVHYSINYILIRVWSFFFKLNKLHLEEPHCTAI